MLQISFIQVTFKIELSTIQELTLPNKENECLFNLNDNFNFDLFKFKLDKLRENNTYVYSRLFISSNKLPATETITYASVPNTYSTGFEINVSDAEQSTV